ncbi:GNAT family N-acetyltransferase [Streptomyces sp. CMB-StM0423]|uniref:GNAT family N-acetyltransferase n=1 Tax=Streptomyces sp. CMB-StM0423 TaxID=2059884 RepID=UPI000C70168F|nr:GNAT family N-acetyltransferase [Streptomyces sp. CMB-StM0423]AUH41932.1 GNAT family N-acetyltransferase [Streptomyces sp. CMB-StM0423]
MDKQVQNFAVANLRRRPDVVETGGFVAGFAVDTDSPYLNYATPLPGTAPTSADVAALVGAFRERGLLPRLEFAPGAAPRVEGALRAAGFGTEAVHEYLVCTPHTYTDPLPGGNRPRVETPATEAEFRALDAALAEAFGGAFAASAEGAARLRRLGEDGGEVRFVRAGDGGCAGGATCSPRAEDTAELAGVGTRPAYRRRGVAAAVTAALTEAMFDRGAGSVWLEYSGAGSRGTYTRVGYRPGGTRLYVSLPD